MRDTLGAGGGTPVAAQSFTVSREIGRLGRPHFLCIWSERSALSMWYRHGRAPWEPMPNAADASQEQSEPQERSESPEAFGSIGGEAHYVGDRVDQLRVATFSAEPEAAPVGRLPGGACPGTASPTGVGAGAT